MIALSELRTLSYNILREDENVTNYPYTLVDSFLNSAQLDFCSGLIKNPFTGAIEKKGKLPFLNTSYFYISKSFVCTYRRIPPVFPIG